MALWMTTSESGLRFVVKDQSASCSGVRSLGARSGCSVLKSRS